MAVPEWELNLFHADPRLIRPQDDADYARAARILSSFGSAARLKLLHALLVGERTLLRAAVWADVPQRCAAAELRELEAAGLVDRDERGPEIEFVPRDGHLVALLYVALAHGRHTDDSGEVQPLLLRERRLAGARNRGRE